MARPSIVALLYLASTVDCISGDAMHSSANISIDQQITMDALTQGQDYHILNVDASITSPLLSVEHDNNVDRAEFMIFEDVQQQEQTNEQRESKTPPKEWLKKAKDVFQKMPQPKAEKLEQISIEEFEMMTKTQTERGLGWFGDSSSSSTNGGASISSQVLLDPSQYYDKWAQAYRMLGGYIDCDHDKSNNNNNQHSNDNNNNNQNNNQRTGCSRWMIWASVSFDAVMDCTYFLAYHMTYKCSILFVSIHAFYLSFSLICF